MSACAKKGCTKYVEVFVYSQLLFESAYLILDVLCCLRMCHVTSRCAEGMCWVDLASIFSVHFSRILSFLVLSREKNSVLDCRRRYPWCSFRGQLHFCDLKRRHMCSEPRGHGLPVHLEQWSGISSC